MYKGLRETQRLGVREVDGQTVSEPGQFCRNEREGRDRAMVGRMGGAEERSIPSTRGGVLGSVERRRRRRSWREREVVS